MRHSSRICAFAQSLRVRMAISRFSSLSSEIPRITRSKSPDFSAFRVSRRLAVETTSKPRFSSNMCRVTRKASFSEMDRIFFRILGIERTSSCIFDVIKVQVAAKYAYLRHSVRESILTSLLRQVQILSPHARLFTLRIQPSEIIR